MVALREVVGMPHPAPYHPSEPACSFQHPRDSTVRAAMRYQHSTDRRDREIAAEMSRRADAAKGVDEETTR